MSSYFDEHNCQPLGQNETPNFHVHLARLLLDTGYGAEFELEFNQLFHGDKKPPASKAFIESLKSLVPDVEVKCSICLKMYEKDEDVKLLPCDHTFHKDCILPWLNHVCTCPICRKEYPTDDKDFEKFKKQLEEKKQREEMIEELHNSMFG